MVAKAVEVCAVRSTCYFPYRELFPQVKSYRPSTALTYSTYERQVDNVISLTTSIYTRRVQTAHLENLYARVPQEARSRRKYRTA